MFPLRIELHTLSGLDPYALPQLIETVEGVDRTELQTSSVYAMHTIVMITCTADVNDVHKVRRDVVEAVTAFLREHGFQNHIAVLAEQL